MTDKQQTAPDELFERLEQPPALKEALKSIELARRQISLYGVDHPNSQAMLEGLARCVTQFVETYERATCVFTKNALIVNEHYFTTTSDSAQIFHRIKARGAMAITLVGPPSADQLREFILFLNVEPRDVRAGGGPSTYLRQHGVSRIVLTESVYTTGDEPDDETCESMPDGNFDDEDRAVAAALDWLSRQDEDDDEELPKLPITQILSDPDSAAKLIREAVTKLHASRRDDTSGEIAGEVVHDLKSLAGTTAEEWDRATPQIRKAISKLPQDMRPSFSGFTFDDDEQDDKPHRCTANISEIEDMVGKSLSENLPRPDAFDSLFGARAYGPLSSWKRELQPTSIIASTGTTLLTLMKWENSACEHGRMANALAELVLRAMDINDLDCALLFTSGLIEEAVRDNESGWKRSNARSALLGLENGPLTTLVGLALENGSPEAKHIPASLVELCPEIAPEMVGMLGKYTTDEFDKSLKRAIIKAGTSASAQLTDLLNTGTPFGKMAALEILIEIGRAWSLDTVASVINGEDTALAVEAIKMLPNARVPMVSEILVNAVSHPAIEVRIAAMESLGELGDPNTLDFIDRIAKRRHFFGRSRFESIRQSALRAAERIRDRQKRAA